MAKVLVVDDEPHIRDLLLRWLAKAGHQVTLAEHALAALDAMALDTAEVVLCDIEMPGHDGRWLTCELRRRYPATAVVLATGVANISPQISMQAGVLAYVLKPFDRERLLGAVAQGSAWHTDAVAHGPRPEDSIDRVMDWLSRIDETFPGPGGAAG
jgi:DNA-binding NtrC family response regulator